MAFRKLMLTIAVAAGAPVALGAASASANTFCDAQVASYRGELNSKVAPVMTDIDNGIAEIRKNNGDPDKIAFKMKDGTFQTLPQLRDLLAKQKAEASKEIDNAADKCANELKPFQDVANAAVTLATGGLNTLLPERNNSHRDRRNPRRQAPWRRWRTDPAFPRSAARSNRCQSA